uniref:Zinc finger CHC2-family protein n=1 Tax=Phaseolus vulgaris TaxID=3885 RepID=I7A4I2_PHAVU|nr:zinc finger CHC2-family protein [Phaseolus vulgaris]
MLNGLFMLDLLDNLSYSESIRYSQREKLRELFGLLGNPVVHEVLLDVHFIKAKGKHNAMVKMMTNMVWNYIRKQEQEEQNQKDIRKQLKDNEDKNMKRNGLMEKMMKEELMDGEAMMGRPPIYRVRSLGKQGMRVEGEEANMVLRSWVELGHHHGLAPSLLGPHHAPRASPQSAGYLLCGAGQPALPPLLSNPAMISTTRIVDDKNVKAEFKLLEGENPKKIPTEHELNKVVK